MAGLAFGFPSVVVQKLISTESKPTRFRQAKPKKKQKNPIHHRNLPPGNRPGAYIGKDPIAKAVGEKIQSITRKNGICSSPPRSLKFKFPPLSFLFGVWETHGNCLFYFNGENGEGIFPVSWRKNCEKPSNLRLNILFDGSEIRREKPPDVYETLQII